jgi:hypothetical protein
MGKIKRIRSTPIKTIDAEIGLANYFKYTQNYVIPNVSWGFHGNYEMDLFIIRKSGYGVEVEIKITVADFKNDLKKRHNHSSRYVKDFYYAMPMSVYEKIKDLIFDHAGVLIIKKIETTEKIIITEVKKPKSNKNAIKLTMEDVLKIGWLSSIRIWTLKKKIKKLQS